MVINDKTLVIAGSVFLGFAALVVSSFVPLQPAAKEILGNIITGLFGIAIGQGLDVRKNVSAPTTAGQKEEVK